MSTANEWDVELNTRREISYLQAAVYYFVYHINTIAFYWQEKSTLLMNENIRIDNPRIQIVKCIGAFKMKTYVESLQKQTMGLIFNIQNSQLSNWSLPTEEIIQVPGQNRPVANLPVVDFRSQPREMPLPKPLNTWVSVFHFVFWFSSLSRKVWPTPSVSVDTNISVF